MFIVPASKVSVGDPVVLPIIRSLSKTPDKDSSPPERITNAVEDFPVNDATQEFEPMLVIVKFPEIISVTAGAVFTTNPTVELADDVAAPEILAPVDI